MKKSIAKFEVYYSQYLDANGSCAKPIPSFALNSNEMVSMYKTMMLTRIFDEKAIALQRTGKLGTYPSIYGLEAIGVGLASAMRSNDIFCPYYRDQAAMIWRGVTMEEILIFWGGSESGSDYKGPVQDLPCNIPIASQTLHAAGIATAQKLKNTSNVVIATLGDGATSRGDFYEAINVSGVWNLPVIYIICNNKYAISVPLKEQTKTETLAQKSIAAGIPCIQIDGNDIIGVRETVNDALDEVRSGNGPMVIEVMSYRLGDHTTADDAKRYRNTEEVQAAIKFEPLIRTREFLAKQHGWTKEQDQALFKSCHSEVTIAVENYLNADAESSSSMFEYLYASVPYSLLSQMEECLAFENHNE